ncbi:hypothetical protein HHK36_002317 [Tetracentron sinense]|uniref:Uncharacterized protein n=1 Tax=Tetracentron sinense TaxID=13715 RepID=A0A834ZYT5_TETSI|nr:hypothetical protein HHK36_002317 [Tetracentron sinense]
MGRIPCCEKDNVKRGQWTPEEDNKLSSYIAQHGTRNWRLIPKNAGLQRCGKSCRLRWTNYLRPDLKHGDFSESEEKTIVKLHSVVGNRYNTPFSHLMAEIATTLAPPQVAHLAEAALGCFKDEMLHLLTKSRIDFPLHRSGVALGYDMPPPPPGGNTATVYIGSKPDDKDDNTLQKIKFRLSRAMQEPDTLPSNTPWAMASAGETSDSFARACNPFSASASGFQYGPSSFGNEGDGSPWTQSMCTGSTCTGGGQQDRLPEKVEDGDGEEAEGGKAIGTESNVFNSDCVLWGLSDDLMNPVV